MAKTAVPSAAPAGNNGLRKSFSRTRSEIMAIPYLLETQRKSYDDFLQFNVMPDLRQEVGLQEAFKSVFPISSTSNPAFPSSLAFVEYDFGAPKYTEGECMARGMTFGAPLKVKLQLIVRELIEETGKAEIKDIKEQEVYMGEIPLMTAQGTFIVNGAERVIVSQLHRSPGVSFGTSTHANGKTQYNARVIPYRGAWVEFEVDINSIMHVTVDRKRKLPATTFLRCFGAAADEEIVHGFFASHIKEVKLDDFSKHGALAVENLENFLQREFIEAVIEPDSAGKGKKAKPLVTRGAKVTKKAIETLKAHGIRTVYLDYAPGFDKILYRRLAGDVIDQVTGEIYAECLEKINTTMLLQLSKAGVKKVEILDLNPEDEDESVVLATVLKDKTKTQDDALIEFFKRMRPGNPLSLPAAKRLFEDTFVNSKRYDLGPVGRHKMNRRAQLPGLICKACSSKCDECNAINAVVGPCTHCAFSADQRERMRVKNHELQERKKSGAYEAVCPDAKAPKSAAKCVHSELADIENLNKCPMLARGSLCRAKVRTLVAEDVQDIIRMLSRAAETDREADDIDHLGNRRVRSVGELLQNQVRLGLQEIEKAVRDKMAQADLENLLPHQLINAKPLISTVKDFFGRSQLSQFMDQTNPLSELTHKRRLSALGPGGLSRERAGFEVRDVHHTHYGRICPIETPEGPNIGLISSLSTYARINDLGFIETPYRKVKDGVVLNDIVWLTADEEDEHTIAQADAPIDEKGRFVNEEVLCRSKNDYPKARREMVDFMDISPKQLVSVSAALIPFLEHDDANRALMGSNMQRQAVPLLFTEAPVVGTGMERRCAIDSGACITATNAGTVTRVESDRIEVTRDGETPQVDVYPLLKYRRSNQGSCINQKPIVTEGMVVAKDQPIADGPAIDNGELALGRNLTVAFMPFGGYNFEDAILISERVVREDIFTSIHIEDFEIDARDTKLGKEDITKDIPNTGEEVLAHLDENGVIVVGSEVQPGDVLVGKVTPKGETELTPEDKLLRAIFGEKAGDYKDASLKASPGSYGTVIETRVFSRKEKTSKSDKEDNAEINRIRQECTDRLQNLDAEFHGQLREMLGRTDKPVINFETGEIELKPKQRVTEKVVEFVMKSLTTGMLPLEGDVAKEIKEGFQKYARERTSIEEEANNRITRIKNGDELPTGVIKVVKVFLACKRKLQVGDKMAGRHGNKGVVARIMPIEDMPFLADGTPVDIVLNPLGVPSRMNVGQILETHLGWAAAALGVNTATPVFEGASEAEIRAELRRAREHKMRATGDTRGYDDLGKDEKLLDVNESGQVTLFDGATGEMFDTPVTVGSMYMLKLAHLVDDKMHARAIGPYSLVTQQPLGGKAQFGGQRFGEMEVWALEAYGAAYTLQELLTVKSDDVSGRTKMYESLIKGQNHLQPGIPESFNVLVKELQGLGLNMELLTEDTGFGLNGEDQHPYSVLDDADDDNRMIRSPYGEDDYDDGDM